MLSLSNGGMSASHAGSYFAADDYYLKGGEPSRWLGKGAAALGLEGTVRRKEFDNVADGKSPDGTGQLVAPKVTKGKDGTRIESHRAGNDLTFSAPKSVSIGYAAGNRELKEIWDRAVVNTMELVEKHYSQYRTPQGVKTTGNLVAAKFDHVTSRALDPEIHSHVFLVNMVRSDEGERTWFANEPKNIYTDKIFLGMAARQEAIRLYREAGYQVRFTDRDKLLFEVEGVRQEEIEAFSRRSAIIAEKVAQWKWEGRFPGEPETILKKMAALDTRDPKHEVTPEDLRQEWDSRFAMAGTTADAVRGRIQASRAVRPGMKPFRVLSPGDYPPTLARIISHTNMVALKAHPGYLEAKEHGDVGAAMRLVNDLVKPEVMEEIRKGLPRSAPLYIVPVLQMAEGRADVNVIPLAYARKLARELGGEVWTGITNISGTLDGPEQAGKRRGLSLAERLRNVQVFRGALPPESSIIIVADDTPTVGGTLASLIDHLELGGNPPRLATTLAVGRYGKELVPTKELIDGLLRKSEISAERFQHEFGYPPESLTGAEIRSYLLNGGRGINGARARFPAAKGGRGPGEDGSPGTRSQPPLERPPKSPDEIVKSASDILTDREVVFDRPTLLRAALQISGGEHPIAELDCALSRDNYFFFLGQEAFGWQAGRDFFTTEGMLRLEARNLSTLKELDSFRSVTSRAEVAAFLNGLAGQGEESLSPEERSFRSAFLAGSRSAAATGPVTLSAGQRQHVVNDLTGAGAFAVTQGDPGTGKTFASGVIERFNAEVLEPSGRGHHVINIAYTGKAALEMERASGREGLTIDSFLGRYQRSSDPAASFSLGAAQGKQVILRLDEASFVGGRQAALLLDVVQDLKACGYQVKLSMIGDGKQLEGVQASPFFSHASQLARDGHGDYAVMKEITRQKDAGLLEVARVLNRDRDPRDIGKNAVDALKMLQQQDRVVELADRGALMRATVDYYLSEAAKPSPDPALAAAGRKQTILVVTPLHADRRDLNEAIREARVRRGELAGGRSVEVLSQVEQGVTVSAYRPGMLIVSTPGRDTHPCNERPHGSGEVIGTDSAHNTVTVRFPGTKEERVETFDASQLSLTSALYRKERKEFAPGDAIVFGKNTRQGITSADGSRNVGVRNGDRGVIESLSVSGDGHTGATVQLDSGKRIVAELERFGPQHLDYAYAITIPKGQGLTIDSVVSFNYVKPATANEMKFLSASVGREVSAEEFKRWNSGLTDAEISYRLRASVGEQKQTGTVSFIMIEDPRNRQAQKGIAIQFDNGHAVAADKTVLLQMKEAGMYWSADAASWVAAATNQEAARLITRHPLKDREYLNRLFPQDQAKTPSYATGERVYQTALDTTREAERFGRMSYNQFNVAFTRESHEGRVFTNSVEGLQQAIKTVSHKTTTIDNALLVGKESSVREALRPRAKPVPVPQTPAPKPPPQAPSIPKPPGQELELKRRR